MKIIVLVGIPGSGKSSFAKKYKKYKIISQDELKSRYMCLSAFRTYLKEGKNIIVDRCNINRMQRTLWINIAKEFGAEIDCINFIINPEIAIKRIQERKEHPTIKEDTTLDKITQIVHNFINTYEAPTLEEGFKKLLFIDAN